MKKEIILLTTSNTTKDEPTKDTCSSGCGTTKPNKRAHRFFSIAIVALLLVAFQQVNAQKLVTVRSVKSFDETVSGIKKGVADAGMMVLAEINHGKILSMTGLSLDGEALFIGNPNVGKQLFSENKAVGLAIPIRVNVYEDGGVTYINYFTPSSVLGNFKGSQIKNIAGELDKKLAMLTGMFAK